MNPTELLPPPKNPWNGKTFRVRTEATTVAPSLCPILRIMSWKCMLILMLDLPKNTRKFKSYRTTSTLVISRLIRITNAKTDISTLLLVSRTYLIWRNFWLLLWNVKKKRSVNGHRLEITSKGFLFFCNPLKIIAPHCPTCTLQVFRSVCALMHWKPMLIQMKLNIKYVDRYMLLLPRYIEISPIECGLIGHNISGILRKPTFDLLGNRDLN